MRETATDTLHSLAAEVRRFVERARKSLDDEIRLYPTSIPRCDAQFNHLYEQRARLARELGAAAAANDSALELVRAFVASAPFGDTDDERQLRSRAASALAESSNERLR